MDSLSSPYVATCVVSKLCLQLYNISIFKLISVKKKIMESIESVFWACSKDIGVVLIFCKTGLAEFNWLTNLPIKRVWTFFHLISCCPINLAQTKQISGPLCSKQYWKSFSRFFKKVDLFHTVKNYGASHEHMMCTFYMYTAFRRQETRKSFPPILVRGGGGVVWCGRGYNFHSHSRPIHFA